MLTIYSYPDLFGGADNNPYGLKVYAFLKLCKLGFRHEHILDTKDAPRWQLPYLQDSDETIGDSDAITEAALEAARAYNFKRYQYQGIGRYERNEVYARGIADLRVLADLVPASGFMFGAKPSSCDAAIYGFIANIYFYEIDTPLKQFLLSRPNLVAHCWAVQAALDAVVMRA